MEGSPDHAVVSNANPTLVEPPFDPQNTGADIIIRSSDQVDFYYNKLLLSLVSPVFQTILLLPQPSVNLEQVQHLPIIPFSENSALLKQLLMWCDPRYQATILDGMQAFGDIVAFLDMITKYDVQSAIDRVWQMIKKNASIIEANPFDVYLLAVWYQVADIARMAARQIVRRPARTWSAHPQIQELKSTQLFNLLRYHDDCCKAAEAAIENFPTGTEVWMAEEGKGCPECFEPRWCQQIELYDEKTYQSGRWMLPVWSARIDHAIRNIVRYTPCSAALNKFEESTDFVNVNGSCKGCVLYPLGTKELLVWLGKKIEEDVDKQCLVLEF